MPETFSPNGRILIQPFNVCTNKNGNDSIKISFYKIAESFTYSIQAQIQRHIYAKWPHPEDRLFSSLFECKIDARLHIKNYCYQNRLKKSFDRLVPSITDQLDLFDNLQ